MFVDVIHSNGDNLILGGLGSWQPMGHVDFYPSGGRMQKGCSNLFVGAVSDIIWSSEVEGRSLCNHRRAYKFFTDSVSPRCHFPAFPCESYDQFLEGGCFPCTGDRRCGNMGYYADRSTGKRSLFLVTRDKEPFCANQYHVRLESVMTDPPAASYGKIQLTLIGSSDLNETFSLTQKDDEQLKAGEPLSRLLVPHPVLQEPTHQQLLYTAYSGWWSSGLSQWAVRKVSLTDSFGKSLSVCNKDLVLETGVPVTLPLYPGECNPPRDFNSTAVPPSTVPETPKPGDGGPGLNVTHYIPTPVVQIGDEGLEEDTADSGHAEDPLSFLDGSSPPKIHWKPVDFQDSSSNSLEDSRAFDSPTSSSSVPPPATTTNNTTTTTTTTIGPIDKRTGTDTNHTENRTQSDNKEPTLPSELTTSGPSHQYQSHDNFTTTTGLPASEIREPVLNPKTTAISVSEDSTHRPSAVKTREISGTSNFGTEDDRRLWIPSAELNPPPLGMAQTWQHWNLAKNNARVLKSQINETKILLPGPDPISTLSTLQKASKISYLPVPVTIQLLPQRLAAFLAQAERYARLTFMPGSSANTPTSEIQISKNSYDDSPTQRRPKQFTTTIRPNHDTSLFQPRKDTDNRNNNVQILVPFFYSYKHDKKRDRPLQYIPVHFPTALAPADRKAEIITITPEDLKKSFRSVKIERNTTPQNPAALLIDGTTDYSRFHPVYSREKKR